MPSFFLTPSLNLSNRLGLLRILTSSRVTALALILSYMSLDRVARNSALFFVLPSRSKILCVASP